MKKAVVVGGSNGIGLAIVNKLIELQCQNQHHLKKNTLKQKK